MVGQRNADIRLRPSQKSQTKLGPKVAAAAHQIQFADQDFTSSSTGPAKSRGPGPGRLLRSPASLHLHVGERRAIASPSENNLATTLGGGVSEWCLLYYAERLSTAVHLVLPQTRLRKSAPLRQATRFLPLLLLACSPPRPESGMVNNRPRAFQINGGSRADGLRKLHHRGAK